MSIAADFQAGGDTQSAFDAIFQAQFLLGLSMIYSAVEAQMEAVEINKRESLSSAGLLGARSRNKPYETLKLWALERAGKMHGAHKMIARQLSTQLPVHLSDISGDPERLIYDTIRKNNKQ